MKGAGRFRRRVTFQQRAELANGARQGPWVDVVTRRADVLPLKGGESVKAQRLEGAQPVIITVRRDALTMSIDNSFRAVDARDPSIRWNITSKIWNEAEDLIEVLATQNINGSDG